MVYQTMLIMSIEQRGVHFAPPLLYTEALATVLRTPDILELLRLISSSVRGTISM